MVEYMEPLRVRLVLGANTFGDQVVTLPNTPFVMSNRYGQLAAFVLHGIDAYVTNAWVTTAADQIVLGVAKTHKTAAPDMNDADVIEEFKTIVQSFVGNDRMDFHSQYVPPIILSQQSLYVFGLCTRAITVDFRLRYTIRLVDRESFVNALVPTN